jgi:alcohol dehydrogenase (cytochrome c)
MRAATGSDGTKKMNRFAMIAAALAWCGAPTTHAAQPASNIEWASYNGNLQSDRFSAAAEITTKNAAKLVEICEVSLGDEGALQPGPVMVNDTLYVTTTHTVVAVEATSCELRWRSVYRPDQVEPFPANRGVAFLDGKIYRGTGDGRLLGLDARTGREIWRSKIADPKIVEFLSAAPIAWKGLVFIGPAGSDWGIRGRISAFDAITGKPVWKFNTVPAPGEAGFDSWRSRDAALHGGGGTWSSYTLDPATGELFVSVANPAPDYRPDTRPGDNLYTNSMVVLDARTGALRWHYQFDPNDGFDYDVVATPTLYTDRAGNRRVAVGGKDGYLYILDRDTHRLISRTAITTIKTPTTPPTATGVFACPGSSGGVEWNGPAYSPMTNLLYVGSVDWCSTFISGPLKFDPPLIFLGTAPSFTTATAKSGWVYAIDATNGATKWRYHATTPVLSGVTPTAGGVLFSGESAGNLLVFDAASGLLLKKLALGGSMGGGVVTYRISARQYVATTAGNVSRSGLGTGGNFAPRLIILATGLGTGHQAKLVDAVPLTDRGKPFGGELGVSAYNTYCAGCHGIQGGGAEGGPSLKNEASRMTLLQLVAWIKNPAPPMPKMVPPITFTEVGAIARYVEELK